MKFASFKQLKGYQKFKGATKTKQEKKQFSIDLSPANHQKSFSSLSNKSFSKFNHAMNFTPLKESVVVRNQAPQFKFQKKCQYNVKDIKKIIQQFFKQIRRFLKIFTNDLQRQLQNIKRKLRQDFQQFLTQGIPKNFTLTSTKQQPDQTINHKFPQFKIKHTESLNYNLTDKISMKNPLSIKKKVQESANMNNTNKISKNLFQSSQISPKRVSKLNQSRKRQKKQRQRSSASKQVMKLQQKLSSLKNMLCN